MFVDFVNQSTLCLSSENIKGDKCDLNGPIPAATIGAFTNLEALDLEYSGLTGTIPTQLGLLSKLTSLELAGNMLIGQIPTQIASLPKLVVLELFENLLDGPLPLFSANEGVLNSIDLVSMCRMHMRNIYVFCT